MLTLVRENLRNYIYGILRWLEEKKIRYFVFTMMLDSLRTHGYALVPVYQQEELPILRAQIDATMNSSPYYQPNPPVRVFGSFQAMSDPWTAWHPVFRGIRSKIASKVFPHLDQYLEKYYPESTHKKRAAMIDRLMIRPPGITISGEAWHRDIAPSQYLPTDGKIEILGGWTNLDDTPQKFRCVPGTQLGSDGSVLDYHFLAHSGFAKVPEEQHPVMEANAITIEIPPGHHFLFHQHIIHTIVKNTNPIPIYRMFQGFMLSTSPTWNEYPFGGNQELERLGRDWATPTTPSGQRWPVYAQNHLRWTSTPFSARPGLGKLSLVDWCRTIFNPVFMNTFQDSKGRVPQILPSLKELAQRGVINAEPIPVPPHELALYLPKHIGTTQEGETVYTPILDPMIYENDPIIYG